MSSLEVNPADQTQATTATTGPPAALPQRSRWAFGSVIVLLISIVATVVVFVFFPTLCASASSKCLMNWFHWLATIALVSTLLWSALAFFGIYIGPQALWEHKDEFGPWVFLGGALIYWFGILICLIAMIAVWYGGVHEHLACIAITEGLFWVFDAILIRKINKLEKTWKNQGQDPRNYQWAPELRSQLQAWIWYVDRPITFAFAVLLFGGLYLESNDILMNRIELENFSSGAVFFALMTANLAFYSINKPTSGLQSIP